MIRLTSHHGGKEFRWWVNPVNHPNGQLSTNNRVAQLQDDVDDTDYGDCDGDARELSDIRRADKIK